MDLNQLYFDHQMAQMRADTAMSNGFRENCLSDAAQFADQIAEFQTALGAAAALAWTARATKKALLARMKSAIDRE